MEQLLSIVIASVALAFSIISLTVSFLAVPKILAKLIEFKAKESSTHTVVPGQLFDMMEKNPDFMPSADDIEFPKDIGKKQREKAGYG